jgi:DNA-binding response OmpR family regulator
MTTLLVLTENELSEKLLGDVLEANAYEVLATSDISEALRFATTRDPDFVLLMFESLSATCNAARQIKPHTSAVIIGFSARPVTATERNAALQSGCDDYRDAFLRLGDLG